MRQSQQAIRWLQQAMRKFMPDLLHFQNDEIFALNSLCARPKLEVKIHDEFFRELMRCGCYFNCLMFV